MSYYAFEGLIPVVHPDAFVHPSAVLIGDVIGGRRCLYWPTRVIAWGLWSPDPGGRL
ncbi:carnitine operon protein CaiE [Salmonella enterica subsp. enterica serovar Typhimurium]|nr:carnitine operon protein CaiE [Salmonella enterica subsp. enterica serovar Typhimurium]